MLQSEVLMAKRNAAGFSLIELIVAVTISSALIGVAFAGQGQLRGRAQFDASVEKIVGSINDAHNESTAGVNTLGGGNGKAAGTPCTATVGEKLLYAGTTWSAVDVAAGSTFTLNYYAVKVGVVTNTRSALPPCLFDTKQIGVGSSLRVNAAVLPALNRNTNLLFLRDDLGGLSVCKSNGALGPAMSSIQAGVCVLPVASGTISMTLTDNNFSGFKSVVQVDASGLAQRIN
jgi:prepilin-type N-terminal cleavage/methylation domain-containing protein